MIRIREQHEGWRLAAIGDFNGDGFDDVIWMSPSGVLGEYRYAPGFGGNIDLRHPMPGWSVAAVGDFNGDGTSDLLWSNNVDGTLGIWRMNPVTGVIFQMIDLHHSMAGWSVAAVGDFNGDGTSDLLWSNPADGTLGVWRMDKATGGIGQTIDLQHPMPGWNVIGTGDFNRDGVTDLLWRGPSNNIGMWLMDKTSGGIAVTTNLGSQYAQPVIADVNHDGTDDITWLPRSTEIDSSPDVGTVFSWLMHDGQKVSVVSDGQAVGLQVLAVGNFVGDQAKEALWQDPYDLRTLFLWPLGSDPTPHSTANKEIGTTTETVAATGDFNGDGTTDLLWSSPLVPNVSSVINRWDMQDGRPTSISHLIDVDHATAVASGDFNNDGTCDLIWRDNDTGALSEWLMAGGTIAQNVNLQHSMPDWNVVATGDYNGDGTADLIWMNASGMLGEWQMKDGAIAQTRDLQHPMPGWNVIGAADFNGDGVTDFLWRNASGVLGEWLMDKNTGMIGEIIDLNHPMPGWTLVLAGNLNTSARSSFTILSDGTADLLWYDQSANQMGVWFMRDGAIADARGFSTVPGLQVMATGDFDGDHNIDLMWRTDTNAIVNTWSIARDGTINDFYL